MLFRSGGRPRNVQPLLDPGDLTAAGVEGARNELVGREILPQIEVRRPGLPPGGAGGPAVDLERDLGGRPFDRDADGMSSENETQEKRGEGDGGHGEL